MQIKCVITDDEPIAREGLRRYLEQIDFISIEGECENGIELMNFLKVRDIDLIFLDIEMPGLSGIDFLSSLEKGPKVIITTAYEQYAIRGYDFEVVDYLLKPISFQRAIKAVNRAYDIIKQQKDIEEKPKIRLEYIFLKSDKKLKKIVLKDILYIESMENYIIINTKEKKETILMTLKAIYEMLPNDSFIQIHRSFIVNYSHINAIEGNMVIINNTKLPIARSFSKALFLALKTINNLTVFIIVYLFKVVSNVIIG